MDQRADLRLIFGIARLGQGIQDSTDVWYGIWDGWI